MNKFKYFLLVLIIFGSFQTVSGQYGNPDEPDKIQEKEKKKRKLNPDSRIFFGGNLGLSFGDYTYVEVAPMVGYKITPRLWAGAGPKYMYEKVKGLDGINIYGVKTFASFTIFKDIYETIPLNIGDIFLHLENETLNFQYYVFDLGQSIYYLSERQWYNFTLAGGGLRFPIGDRSSFSMLVLWDLSQYTYSPYSNPEVRLIFNF